MPDFSVSNVEVRSGTDGWGPHNFDFVDSIPAATEISAAVVKSYVGQIDRGATLASYTESTSVLIDTAQTAVRNDTTVDVYFNHPGAAYSSATGITHTLVFELTLDNAAEHSFYFHRVVAYAG